MGSSIKKPILLNETGVQLVNAIKEQTAELKLQTAELKLQMTESKLQTSALRTQAVMLSVLARGSMSNVTSWRDIQAIVRQGWAREVFHVGDQFVIKWTNKATNQVYDVPLDVVHFGDVKLASGRMVPGMYLQWHYGIYLGAGNSLEFDAPEPNHSLPSIRDGGNCNWADSAARKWLNSTAGVGKWWSASTSTDHASVGASTLAGFMSGFEDDFLSAIAPIQITTGYWKWAHDLAAVIWQNTITNDTFFLPSVEQIYGSPQIEGEGEAFEYWRNISGRTTPQPLGQANKNPAFVTYALENSNKAVFTRLRSCERTAARANVTYVITNEGGITTRTAADATIRFAPVCVIH